MVVYLFIPVKLANTCWRAGAEWGGLGNHDWTIYWGIPCAPNTLGNSSNGKKNAILKMKKLRCRGVKWLACCHRVSDWSVWLQTNPSSLRYCTWQERGEYQLQFCGFWSQFTYLYGEFALKMMRLLFSKFYPSNWFLEMEFGSKGNERIFKTRGTHCQSPFKKTTTKKQLCSVDSEICYLFILCILSLSLKSNMLSHLLGVCTFVQFFVYFLSELFSYCFIKFACKIRLFTLYHTVIFLQFVTCLFIV